MTGERERRVGQNEALFRQVNDRVEDLNAAFATMTRVFDVVCECGSTDCMAQVAVPRDAYERVRAEPTWFIMRPGHEVADVEHVIEEHGGYNVVRKDKGLPEEIARQTDLRNN